jgi:ribose 5-phosphate isomerase B
VPGGRIEGPALAWDLVETFLAARYSQAERHLRRLTKVAALETAHRQKDPPT